MAATTEVVSFDVETRFMQGRAASHLDRHVVVKDLVKAAKALKMCLGSLEEPVALLALYDGHFGPKCSEYCTQNFHKKLLHRLSNISTHEGKAMEAQIRSSLVAAIADLDAEYISKHRSDRSGCSVQIALFVGPTLYIAGLGSARAALFSEEEGRSEMAWQCRSLNSVHLTSNTKELERVKNVGGTIVDLAPDVKHIGPPDYDRRVKEFRMQCATGMGLGQIPPLTSPFTRSLGDRELKIAASGVNSEAEVSIIRIGRHHRALALFSDGVANVMSDDEISAVLHFNSNELRRGSSELVQSAYNRGSEDNLTAIVAQLRLSTKRARDVTTAPAPLTSGPQAAKSLSTVEPALPAQTTALPKAPMVVTANELMRAAKLRRRERELQDAAHPEAAHLAKDIVSVNGPIATPEEHTLKLLAFGMSLFEDDDGDVAHEFLEEASECSVDEALRPVLSASLRRFQSTPFDSFSRDM